MRSSSRTSDDVTLDDVLEAVQALSDEEQAQLRRVLDSDDEKKKTEAAFARRMVKEGILESRRTSEAEAASFQPVSAQGKPASAIVIEERR